MCVVVKPAVESLARSFSVPLTVLDVDIIEDETITKVPTLRLYKDNVLVSTIVTKHVEALKELLTANAVLGKNDDF